MPTFTVRLMGTKFRPREAREIASHLQPNDPVTLEAEPDNAYDPCAIKVIAQGEFIGYVQKDMAQVLHPYAFEPMTAYVSENMDAKGEYHLIEVVI
jgi:hypothetical protein